MTDLKRRTFEEERAVYLAQIAALRHALDTLHWHARTQTLCGCYFDDSDPKRGWVTDKCRIAQAASTEANRE